MNQTVLTVVGNVATEPVLRKTAEQIPVANFRLASTERRFDKELGQWVDGDTLFIAVTCWRKLAERVGETLRTGDPVLVTGKIVTKSFEHEGNMRTVTEMTGYAIGPNIARCSVSVRRANQELEPVELVPEVAA
ncbi:single-stranded DNA-binding protein [Sciscionella marina]|uniref:single-stranded DNA-binding protein n=1 Tax=Sciscionella marina TaxID=508770 RepID=UPI0003A74770|nr:single-stranded DNA-binding protein [Sciscionella marina]